MNLRQLRYITEVARHGLNVSATADALFTSQPGVSKQIRQLEDELGVQIFERSGRQLTRITPAGRAIIELANRALIEVDSLEQAAQEYSDPAVGELSLAATQTVARYVFPPVVEKLTAKYPRVHIRFPRAIRAASDTGTHRVGAVGAVALRHGPAAGRRRPSAPLARW